MFQLNIKKVEGNQYFLTDLSSGKDFKVNLTFYGLENAPKPGETLIMHAELFDPKYEGFSQEYFFWSA